jgi:hypothetical protein
MAITRLQVEETRTGLYGRTIVTLCRPNVSGTRPDLPTNNFGPGDIIQLLPDAVDQKSKKKDGDNAEEEKASGLVYKMTQNRVQVAFNQPPDLVSTLGEQDTVTMVLMANDVTFKRMDKSCERLKAMHRSGDVPRCLQVLFGQTPNSVDNQMLATLAITPYNPGLNEPQIEAIKCATYASLLFLAVVRENAS